MKNKILVSMLLIGLSLNTTNTMAQGVQMSSTPMVDEFGMPITGNANNPQAQATCTQSCNGYSPDTTECPDGFMLQACLSDGCGNFFKCEPKPCAEGYTSELKDCPIEVQIDNYMCSRCK